MAETFDDFCRTCLDLLKRRRVDYVIIGGVAVTAVGEARFTADLDAIVFVELDALAALLHYAKAHGFELDVAAELAAARAGTSVRLTRGRFHFDLVVRSLFIEDQALARAKPLKLFRRTAKMPTPEDLLVLKLVAGRPRDLLDAEGIVRRHGTTLDVKYVERTLQKVCELAEDHAVLERWRAVRGAR